MDKKISELDQALQINNDAVFPISQNNGGTDTTYKVSITQISAEVGEDQTFSNLDTTDKTLVGAINEIAQGGGGGGSSTLAGLTDVDIDDQTLSDGQVLKYDSVEEKWVNNDVGAGGHTIVADDGTDLAQRANLKFGGTYSEDDSINDTTLVNVTRSMSSADYSLLSADEKAGIIEVYDETSGADDKFQPVIYSEEEREIGVWIDGKPLYQKTIKLQNVTVQSTQSYNYDVSALNIDTPIGTPQGFIVISSGTDKRTLPFNILTGYGMTIQLSKTTVSLSRTTSDITCEWVIFTIQYTKTTDQAGSGQWTPQGVPAVHFSTDEQIIGTWIDGKTLYQKTVTTGGSVPAGATLIERKVQTGYDTILYTKS